MRTLITLALCSLFLSACNFSERGFRYSGEYRAAKSQFTIDLISRGFVKPGNDLAESAFAIVQFCPLSTSAGIPFRVSMTSVPNEGIKVECMECPDPSVSLAEWNWKTSDRLVSNLLSKASYSNIDSEEVKDMVRAMGNSLSGPKGFIMKGQGRSIDVLRDDIQYGYKVEKEKPYKAWIKSEELPSCHAG